MEKINMMIEMAGEEVWTNAFGDRFGERVCIGVEGEFCIREGEKFKPTKKEINNLWNDHIKAEFGNPSQRIKELKEEFTPEYCKTLLAECN